MCIITDKRIGGASICMNWTYWALLLSGGFILSGIAYPAFARTQLGWKTGASSHGAWWSLWYGFGALSYLAGMGTTFGWIGLVAAIPAAFAIGFALMMAAKRNAQMIALIGPILANLWFMVH